MNYIAHLALSGKNQDVILGNYAGDFVKGQLPGKNEKGWSESFINGLRLHRFIDSFTDTHPLTRTMKQTLAEAHGKTSSVAVDLFFDYFLANHFQEIYDEPLELFLRRMYSIILSNLAILPDEMQPMARSMVNQDWLSSYASVEGIGSAIRSMAKRRPFLARMTGAEQALLLHYDEFDEIFSEFYLSLKSGCEKWLENARIINDK